MNGGWAWPLMVFLWGGYADFHTTRIGFAHGFGEANPIVRYVLKRLPWDSEVELHALKLVVFSILALSHAPSWVFYVLGVSQFGVAYLNFKKLRKESIL